AAILALLAIALGLAPVVAAWLLKLVLDELATEREWTVLLGLGVALAAAGIAAGVVPRLNQYIENAMTRAVRLVTAGRLFGAVNSRLRGLKAIEDPELHDRLRSAQNSGAQAPSEIVSSVLLMARQLITALGFVGTLLVMNPLLGGLVAASSIPMVRAEVVLARQRAVAMHRIVCYRRRQLFYSNLLVSPREAKVVRLFNLGEHFRERLLREQRAINSTEQQVDRRDLHVQTILMGLAA